MIFSNFKFPLMLSSKKRVFLVVTRPNENNFQIFRKQWKLLINLKRLVSIFKIFKINLKIEKKKIELKGKIKGFKKNNVQKGGGL